VYVRKILFDGTIWLSMTTLVFGVLALVVLYVRYKYVRTYTVRTTPHTYCKACYRSKCKNFKCCYGLLEIQRDTNVEEYIDIEGGIFSRSDYAPEQE
jgi:hypothetical protein